MLKRHKNELFEIIRASGLGIDNFSLTEAATVRIIRYKETSFDFRCELKNDSFELFIITYTAFQLNFPHFCVNECEGYARNLPVGFRRNAIKAADIIGLPYDKAKESFILWLNKHLKEYINDLEEINLWESYKNSNKSVSIDKIEFEERTKFSVEEKLQIKIAIGELKVLITQKFQLAAAQAEMVNARLDYLIESTERLNKFDWKSVVINTAISITVALSMDTETGRQLFDLFRQALQMIPKLMGA